MFLPKFIQEMGSDLPLPSVDFMDGLMLIVSPFQLILNLKFLN